MSKASEYATKGKRPTFTFSGAEKAHVTDSGDCSITGSSILYPTEALALAKWIIDTFTDYPDAAR